MLSATRPTRHRKALTLLEVTASLAVLATILVLVIQFSTAVSRAAREAQLQRDAQMLAANTAERLMSLADDAERTQWMGQTHSVPGRFTQYETTITSSSLAGTPEGTRYDILVQWGEAGRERRVTLSTWSFDSESLPSLPEEP